MLVVNGGISVLIDQVRVIAYGSRGVIQGIGIPDWSAGLMVQIQGSHKPAKPEPVNVLERIEWREKKPQDQDRDQVIDEYDQCPTLAGVIQTNGCPPDDLDGDEVKDHQDWCLGERGDPAYHGCTSPNMIPPDLRKPLLFSIERHRLTKRIKRRLDRVATYLTDHPGVRVHFAAHSDYQGPARYNMYLSKLRLRSVISYLTEQGVTSKRITSSAHGETTPLVRDEDAEDRKLNRRLVISFILPNTNGK